MLHNRLRAASAAGSGLSYYDEVMADSPLSYWRLEETSGTSVADEMGVRNGTVYGANLNTPGVVGSAAYFDGTNRIEVGQTSSNMPQVTCEAIINSSNYGSQGHDHGSIIDADNETDIANNRGWQFLVNKTSGVLLVTKITNSIVTCVSTTDVRGAYHHAAFTYDGAAIRVYVDGVLEGTTTASGPITAISGPLWIGAWVRGTYNGYRRFVGTIDEPAMYGTALSGDRILAHAQAAGLA